MSDAVLPPWLLGALEIVPGVLALGAAFVGFGSLRQRVMDMENALDGDNGLKAQVAALKAQLSDLSGVIQRLDERSAAQNSTLRDISQKLDGMVLQAINGMTAIAKQHGP
jgi:hypothetical protein